MPTVSELTSRWECQKIRDQEFLFLNRYNFAVSAPMMTPGWDWGFDTAGD